MHITWFPFLNMEPVYSPAPGVWKYLFPSILVTVEVLQFEM